MNKIKLGLIQWYIKEFGSCFIFVMFFCYSTNSFAATKKSVANGNWSSAATWSPSGVPANGDDVVISGNYTVTIDGEFTCNNLDIGDATNKNTTLQITSGSNSLTINGDLRINPGNKGKTFILDAGPGTINVSGTFSTWSASGTNNFQVSTGAINFTPSVTIADNGQNIIFNDAGSVTFYSDFTDIYNNLFTYAGCTVNFGGAYIVSNQNATWGGNGTANFFGSSASITPIKNVTFNDVHFTSSSSTTLNSNSGTVVIAGNVTLASGSVFTANMGFELDSDWTNNGGTFNAGGDTIILGGASNIIGGTSSTSFPTLQIGKSTGSSAASYSMNNNNTCDYIVFDASAGNRTLTLGSGVILTVINDITINQPSSTNTTNSLFINSAACNINGNLNFSGGNNNGTKVCQVVVTSGSLTINGNVSWLSNNSVTSELITVSTGIITFNKSLTMGDGSGTVAVTSTGKINFNGNIAPSLSFGGSHDPVLTTTSGCWLHFEKGITTVTSSLTFAGGSNITVGSDTSASDFTIYPGTTITNNGTTTIYGNLTSTSVSTFVNAANSILELKGSVSPNVTLTATATGNNVKYNSGGSQTVKGVAYYNLTLDSAGTKSYGSGITVNNNLSVSGAAVISNSSSISISGNFIYSSSAISTLSNNLTAYGVILSNGTLNDGGNTITINNGNGWVRTGGTFTTTGTVAFTGSTPSFIAGSLPTTFNNLTINNSEGVTLNLSPAAATIVASALTLTNGVITSTSSNILKLAAGSTASSGSVLSYVSGPMIKVGNTDFTFPVGKSGKWMRVGISGLSNVTTEVSAEYFDKGNANLTSLSGNLTQVSPEEYWLVDRAVTSDPVKLKFYWENSSSSAIIDCSYLTIAHYTGGVWKEESATVTGGSSCSPSGSGSIEMNSPVSTFSPFSFGGSGGTSLPIKLVSFTANTDGNVVLTNWVTKLEINNAYFTLERSSDGEEFSEIANVDGAGNSTSTKYYSFPDIHPLSGVSYYRLRQTDYDGSTSYSDIVTVNIKKESSISIYPNPVQSEMFISSNGLTDEIKLSIYDMTGRKLYSNTIQAGKEAVSVPIKTFLPSGIYVAALSSSETQYTQEIIIQ